MKMKNKANLIANAYNLAYPQTQPVAISNGHCCVLTGESIQHGYLIKPFISRTTNDFWVFRGMENGYMSVDAARCYSASNPRVSMICSKSIAVFGDTGYEPLISRKAARERGRIWWSKLVRDVWEHHRGEACIIILSTDTKTRIWHQPHVRSGVLGERTPVTIYDTGEGMNETIIINWPMMLEDLAFVETILGAGFWMSSVRTSLLRQNKNISISIEQKFAWERKLSELRKKPHFAMIRLIARPKEKTNEHHRYS